MADTYDNEMRGVLFAQEAESDRHPNMTGKIQINGKEYRLAGWSRKSQGGKKYLSLQASVPQEKTEDF